MNPSVANYALIQIVRIGGAYADRNRLSTGRTSGTVRGYQHELRVVGRLAPPVMAKRALGRSVFLYIGALGGYRPLLPR